jgi:serine/alanine adding enzyme
LPVEVCHATTLPEEWDPFARRHGCFYHESAWITGLAATLRYRTHWLTAHRDGALVGGLALAEVPGMLGGHRLVSYPFSFVAGAMSVDADAGRALAEGARDLAGRTGAKRVELKQLGDHHPLAAGFERITRYTTYRVATADGEQALWKRLHRTSTQQRIKKGEKAGVQVVEGRSEEDWLAMAKLEEEIQRGHGVPAPPRRIFLELGRKLQDAGLADLYLAKLPDGTVAAGYVMFTGQREWVYAFSAADPRYVGEYRPIHVILWAGLQRAAAKGITVDLGRTAPEQASLAEFKQRWGSESMPLAYDYSPAIGGLAAKRRDGGALSLATAVWSRLPRPVARLGSALYRYLG